MSSGANERAWKESEKKEMMHIIFGLFFIALGIWGVFDEWYYVVDFVKGSSSVLLVVAGLFGIFAGVAGPRKPAEKSDDELEIESGDEPEVPEDSEASEVPEIPEVKDN